MSITPILAGALALLFLVLSVNVVRTRRASKVNIGDGGDQLLQRRIRAHGNFAEYVPLVLLLIVFAEEGGAATWLVYALGGALLLARLMHGFALSSLTLRPFHRTGGVVLTMIVLASAAATCLQQGISALLD